MKNRLFFAFSLSAFLLSILAINGCKDTATDPTYLALAEIRFANYHQVDPIEIFMYSANATSADSMSRTPTPMTYGLVTPYFNNLPTNRDAGMKYHLVARLAGTTTILKETDVILKPGDKMTWLISGNEGAGNVDATVIPDNHPDGQDPKFAYFRFMNVTPDHPTLTLMVGDPIVGDALAPNVAYKTASAYKGIPTKQDTTVTFYVVESGVVLGRLAGVGLQAGSYHTITWGGATKRIEDPLTGNFTLNDTVRIRILDDDSGTDLTFSPPLTFRFNIINALVPPNFPGPTFVDYSASGGLAIVINNNTVYDYKNVMPFTVAPWWGNTDGANSNVFSAVPTTLPLLDKMFFKFVKPAAGNANPSTLDTNLFRFYAGNGSPLKSDQLYTVIVFDTVKKIDPKAANNSAPFDSAFGTFTIPIPDVLPDPNSARVVFGYMLAGPYRTLKGTSNNGAKLYWNDNLDATLGLGNKKLGSTTKTVDTSLTVSGGQSLTLKAVVGASPDPVDEYSITFTPEAGGIYEAFLVGQRGRPDNDPFYKPHFMVIRVNPK